MPLSLPSGDAARNDPDRVDASQHGSGRMLRHRNSRVLFLKVLSEERIHQPRQSGASRQDAGRAGDGPVIRRHLTLVISSLGSGGAERVLTILANSWVNRGAQVTLITLDASVPFYPLDPRVSLRPLGVTGVSTNLFIATRNNLRRVGSLRRAIRESHPDAVVSFVDVTNVLTVLATRGLGVPVLLSERSDPAFSPVGKTFRFLRRHTYPRAEALVVQSKEARSFFSPAIQARANVIPNPVVPAGRIRREESAPSVSGRTVVSLGRLSKEKGFDLLIDGFARIASSRPEWSLEIWGEGPERPFLQKMVAERRLTERIQLPGETRSPQEALLRADLFVLSSRFEGFPNALCEAMACGLPVLAADCPSGPRQIVRSEVDGILIPPEDPAALAEGMRRLMEDAELRRRLARRAPEVVERFSLDRVLGLWDTTLEEAARRRTRSSA